MNTRNSTTGSERTVWHGHTSALTLTGWILLAVFGFWLVIPLLIAGWKLLELKCHLYKLTEQELVEQNGVFNKHFEHMELYRVQDVTYRQTWWQRIFDLGDISIIAADATHPRFELRSITNPDGLVRLIRHHTNEAKLDSRHFEINVNQPIV